ncbi:MAG: Smr/MutS family protein [Candidatus Margulisbacteria bacterium]|nr:Smr/MutS family protein [Candidatus Margulisiibacteriota bacterium]
MSRREIDLHGLYCEQAELILERELLTSSGVTELVIIHGKGTGALRESVMKTLYAHKDKWVDIIKGENTMEIGDSGFLKVRLKYKEIIINKYSPRKNKKSEESLIENTYLDGVNEKKEKGKQRYLKRMKRS